MRSRKEKRDLLSIKEATDWASEYIKKNVTESNISYLIQYGRIHKFQDNGSIYVDKNELIKYYDSYYGKREIKWKEKLGDDLNWRLSFDYLKEKDTTKHVHRLHPYKGKFIPQLVEYFLDDHTDKFKKEVYFREGDIILDPFCGSGTALVQANELGMHAIGIEVSAFNCMISNVKVANYDLVYLKMQINKITRELRKFVSGANAIQFERKLLDELNKFNSKHFPSPEFKLKVRNGEIDEKSYSKEKEKEFLKIYEDLIKEYKIKTKQKNRETFLDKWYLKHVRDEIEFVFEQIKRVQGTKTKKILALILSRTIRSCRATTHADLATLKDPVYETYYCRKHKKICKPLFTITRWWKRYSKDTLKRLNTFSKLRTDTHQICLVGDSQKINLFSELETHNKDFANLARTQKIRGIFSSPPYVGLIDYHEQHAYAYDLFGFDRRDELEIGPLSKGRSREARKEYVEGVSKVLKNCKNYMIEDYDVFLVANDRYNLYPTIAEKAGMKIVNQFKRPVLNRTEKDKTAYSEIIFHLKEK
jgi:DNA modification methylase